MEVKMEPITTEIAAEIITEGIKFLLGQALKFLNLYREKVRKGEKIPSPPLNLNLDEFKMRLIEIEVESLMTQIETHQRVLAKLEDTRTRMGEYTPPYISLDIEDRREDMYAKGKRLKELLEQAYNKTFEVEGF
jgi:hypothetical protein